MSQHTAILWVRNDFRLSDNRALTEGSRYKHLLPVFVWDDSDSHPWKPGAASKWWINYGLKSHKQSLGRLGSDLLFCKGLPERELPRLAEHFGAEVVLWNRSHDPSEKERVQALKGALEKINCGAKAFHGSLLCSLDFLRKADGSPYLVYTPFWKNFLAKYESVTLSRPKKLPPLPRGSSRWGCGLEDLDLLPHIKWYEGFTQLWSPGEASAIRKLETFLDGAVENYDATRDMPQRQGTSMLSPHLHFGEIHPQRALSMVIDRYGPLKEIRQPSVVQFCKEILWREFSYHLLQHFPETPLKPLRESFKMFPWKKNQRFFDAWTQGKTGYPMVDAGMRQLWQTGWMHNRVRMIAASFLVKHLNIRWQEGAKWFWDTLLDADLASNTMGWQWVAGCGADAAPFFRIFNPITQGEKFDPNGDYARRWCPELSALPAKWIYKPWEAPGEVLRKAGVTIGVNYPPPIVDHKEARNLALDNYRQMQNRG